MKPNAFLTGLATACLLVPSAARADAAGESRAPDPATLRPTEEEKSGRLGWWRDARFGMFIHWGVYSGLGGEWKGKRYGGYAEHIQRALRIPIPEYRAEVAGKFNPAGFNADEWILHAKEAGMGYFVITAKHHDGFALFDSKASDYNVVKATPFARDPMKELREAATRHGIKFGFYYSHAFDWGEENAPGNDWDYNNPGGDKLLHGSEWWLKDKDFIPKARRYVDEKAIPQVLELIRNYDPDILWFDTPHKLPPEENLRIIAAVRRADPTIVINSRVIQGTSANGGLVDYKSTTDKPAEFFPVEGDWEAIPTTNESYGFSAVDRSHKPPAHFIRLLAKAVNKGGNVLMNIGPMGDGRFEDVDIRILQGIGQWMSVNGESIRGCTRSPLAMQSWGVTTLKGNTLYLHVFRWPRDGKLTVAGLKSDVLSAGLLAGPGTKLTVTRSGPLDVVLSGLPESMPDQQNTVIRLELASAPVADGTRFLDPAFDFLDLHVFDAEIANGLGYGTGKAGTDHVVRWTKPGQSVTWPVRVPAAANYRVLVSYDAPKASKAKVVDGDAGKEAAARHAGAGGTFQVSAGDQSLEGEVQSDRTSTTTALGTLALTPETKAITVTGLTITGEELFRLRSLKLERVD